MPTSYTYVRTCASGAARVMVVDIQSILSDRGIPNRVGQCDMARAAAARLSDTLFLLPCGRTGGSADKRPRNSSERNRCKVPDPGRQTCLDRPTGLLASTLAPLATRLAFCGNTQSKRGLFFSELLRSVEASKRGVLSLSLSTTFSTRPKFGPKQPCSHPTTSAFAALPPVLPFLAAL